MKNRNAVATGIPLLVVTVLIGLCGLTKAAVIDFEHNLPSQDDPVDRPSLGFRTEIQGSDYFAIVEGESLGDPGGWGLEGTAGPRLMGFYGDWLGFSGSYTGPGDTVYSRIYFTEPDSMAARTVDVTFDVLISTGNFSFTGSDFKVYGFLDGSQVDLQDPSFSQVTVNGYEEYKASISLTGVDEIRYASQGPGGMDDFNFNVIPEPASLSMLGIVSCIGLFFRRWFFA